MATESKGIGPYPAPITRLQEVARPVTVRKDNAIPAEVLQFERSSQNDAAVVDSPAQRRNGVRRLNEGEVEKLLDTLPRRLAEAMVNGRPDPLSVHKLNPKRVMDLVGE